LTGGLFIQFEFAFIPDFYCPGPVLPFRYTAGKVNILYGVVFYLDSQTLDSRFKRYALGYRPTLEDALHLQTEIIVKTGCLMLLDNEAGLLLVLFFTPRFGGFLKVSLCLIFFEVHNYPSFTP